MKCGNSSSTDTLKSNKPKETQPPRNTTTTNKDYREDTHRAENQSKN